MMNNGAVLFLGVLLSLAGSFWALLLVPQIQIGRQQVRALEGSGEFYPAPRSGHAQRGAQVFVAQGCAECHTRQVRQTAGLLAGQGGRRKETLVVRFGKLLEGAAEGPAQQIRGQ